MFGILLLPQTHLPVFSIIEFRAYSIYSNIENVNAILEIVTSSLQIYKLDKAKVLSNFLCPPLPNCPHQTVVVVNRGQDGLSQTLYLQKWPKSVFEIVVRVER